MTTFKDIHGQTLFEILEPSSSNEAIAYARRYNQTHARQVVEIDYHDGRVDFVNTVSFPIFRTIQK
ncbi:hypothetical protein [Fodinibius sediminis]|uniref:Uncharacterized protein n=1 Tax=Fodinibius sediminis TaxID=1214077 RepID=A0A521AVN5_9BACT|nr:hypothetical protein [Fodinibius sediminis]SMO38913.1 hypothetical protein SAMN06265218_101419 [Fodinibius sediminis]